MISSSLTTFRATSRTLLVFLAIAAAGIALPAARCSAVVDPPGEPGPASESDLRLRWARWRGTGIRSYTYDLRRSCFCVTEYRTPARVTVRDGRVVAAQAIETGEPLRAEIFEPIDSLFAAAIAEADRGGHVEAAYHARLHYPTRLVIGTLANDAGTAFELSNVTELR